MGDIAIFPIVDGRGVEVAAEILSRPGVVDPWACHQEHLGPGGTLELPLGGFCVGTGDRVVLVDTGAGAMDDGRYAGGGLLDSLRQHGIDPREVTDVVFTHLHFDHIGWASYDGSPTFPNASYRLHQADWDHFVAGPIADPRAVEKLSPVIDRLEPFTGDLVVAPGVDARHVPGHTPGSTVYVVSSRGERAVLLGDVAHSVVQLSERDWQVVWDIDPAAASAVRNRLADDAVEHGDLVVAAHFPDMRFGRVITTNGLRRFVAV